MIDHPNQGISRTTRNVIAWPTLPQTVNKTSWGIYDCFRIWGSKPGRGTDVGLLTLMPAPPKSSPFFLSLTLHQAWVRQLVLSLPFFAAGSNQNQDLTVESQAYFVTSTLTRILAFVAVSTPMCAHVGLLKLYDAPRNTKIHLARQVSTTKLLCLVKTCTSGVGGVTKGADWAARTWIEQQRWVRAYIWLWDFLLSTSQRPINADVPHTLLVHASTTCDSSIDKTFDIPEYWFLPLSQPAIAEAGSLHSTRLLAVSPLCDCSVPWLSLSQTTIRDHHQHNHLASPSFVHKTRILLLLRAEDW
ncbi:hypothetical protein BDQ12DRAFT_771653 [Crucibulum laeve]|uniref:Uncharacterized protein n=1 Tax=Crucibulum laeve TaxID=68775 RepID=A0A5C3LIM6_9AGAR|nr:hypothetical protein BDQ12DRAFT_771653 [Crucibulum laeve]